MADGIYWQLAANTADRFGQLPQQYFQGRKMRQEQDVYEATQDAARLYAAGDQRSALVRLASAGQFKNAAMLGHLDRIGVPDGFVRNPNNPNAVQPMQGGHADPEYIQRVTAARQNQIEAGFERDPNNPGVVRPIPGGSRDPAYMKRATQAQREPVGPNYQKITVGGEEKIMRIEPNGQATFVEPQQGQNGPLLNSNGGPQIPPGVDAKTYRTKLAEEEAKALITAPRVVASGQQMLKALRDLKGDKALDNSVGMFSILQRMPGSDAYRVGTRVDQLRGMAFLQIYDQLRGAGQITEVEGAKGEAAFARIKSAQNAKDFRAALDEAEAFVQSIVSREQKRIDRSKMPRLSSPQQMQQLQPGSRFIGPDGEEYTVPPRL